jgi:F1F0 ATPase subunit 2
MTETLSLAPAFAAGVLLGLVFFGGLWWTIRKCLSSPYPALWFLGSQLLRTTIVLAGFFLVARGDWRKLLACVAGFVLARLIGTQLSHWANRPASLQQEAGHASESR